MNLRHIEVFHAVYANGSVSAAARALNVSQPSVTKVLQHAETLLGFALFERTRGRLVPTQEAHALFNDVADIQERVYQLRKASQNVKRGRGAMLRISTLPSLGLGALPEAVSRFLAAQPGVGFELHTVHHDDMVRKLYERETDIVISYEVPRAAAVASRRLGRGEMVAMFRTADFPDASARLTLDQLRGRPFITTVESGPQGRALSAEMARLDVVLDEVVASRTFFVAAALVRAGVGLTIVDSFTAQASLTPDLSIRPLDPPIGFDVHAVYLESRPLGKLADQFLKHLAQGLHA
ncbi:DNA-binding transcriptional LysR family regulator [Sphingomonas insulae]|uniref:LysR substrate-binding domain-containing protein n=2 Tax=Sphingomonas insulae TaxID=424800 RepID=A0ABP3ST02_9SPHN|nr:LysR substrate-binding domain-containing protein [Sphingomonas insulae]NIJ31364.1 DNA-binding transcriptional LysR family regulator [Sphingomonas insulae]